MTLPTSRRACSAFLAHSLAKKLALVICLILASALMGSCAYGDAAARPLHAIAPADLMSRPNAEREYRFDQMDRGTNNSDSLFVVMALSGGGTRAASLAFGVLRELDETHITWEGSSRTMLQELDVMSSVSGGSFAATYYAAFGRDAFFKKFPSAFLTRNVQKQLLRSIETPIHWFRYLDRNYSRIDFAADLYRRDLFQDATFAKIERRPYLIINSTDMTGGNQFSFTQEQFDPMCRNVRRFSLARAVAASSAFPILLTPLTVENYASYCRYEAPAWTRTLEDCDRVNRYEQNCEYAKQLWTYDNPATRPFIHLIDGGVADNVGLLPILRSLGSESGDFSIARLYRGLRNTATPRPQMKVVVIAVNARTGGRTRIDERSSTPGFRDVLPVATGTPMARYTNESLRRLTETVKARRNVDENTCMALAGANEQCAITVYPIEICFDDIKDAAEREFFLNLPTSFQLPERTTEIIANAGSTLLRTNPEFERLLQDLKSPAAP